MSTFKKYEDAGHGWLAVKRGLLKDLGIAGKVSSWSYERGKTVYLEEDADMGLFLRAWKEKTGQDAIVETVRCKRDMSPIRNYDGYRP